MEPAGVPALRPPEARVGLEVRGTWDVPFDSVGTSVYLAAGNEVERRLRPVLRTPNVARSRRRSPEVHVLL